jgi:hypothetical protein
MNAVLITVQNGEKVLDSGTGFVIGQANAKSYVLTCAHTLKAALGRQTTDSKVEGGRVVDGNTAKIFVAGKSAGAIDDDKLKYLDLAVLIVDGIVGLPVILALEPKPADGKVTCEGFTFFFRCQFAHRKVKGRIQATSSVITAEGDQLSYLEIQPTASGGEFEKGLSGAPVMDGGHKVIGIARILDGVTKPEPPKPDEPKAKSKALGYAVKFTLELLRLIREKIPTDGAGTVVPWEGLLQVQGTTGKAGAGSQQDLPPPTPPPPDNAEDIQKGRWGGISEGFGREVTVENVREHKHSFTFDAVVRSTDGSALEGPVIFHLHDTFAKSVIWIRKITGNRAVLAEIESFGTFTIGVQFKDKAGVWQCLEYDLEKYKSGELKKYD